MKKTLKHSLLFTFICAVLCSCTDATSSSENKKSESSEDPTLTLSLWDATDNYKYTYRGLDEDTMPISGWVAPSSIYGCNTNEQYKILKESGLNSILGLYENMSNGSGTEIFKALEYAENNDISYIIRDTSISSRCEDLSDLSDLQDHIDEFINYKSFGGFFPADEPSKEAFNGLKRGSLGMQLVDPSLLYYINLFPNYADIATQCKADSYDDYVESFIKTVSPQFISYDFYGNKRDFPNVSGDYFGQLDTMRKFSQKYSIPFWSFICSTAHFDIRVPHDSDIYWQVNTDLAYGAKGIQYFCYQTPSDGDGFQDNGTSLVDRSGKQTQIYYYCRSINNQIARMDKVLMNSTSIALMAYNDSPRPINSTLVESCREIESIETDDDLLVGCFDHDGKSAFYFVNNNLADTMECVVNFTDYVEANTYDMYEDDTFKGNKASISLEPGQAVLYELTNYKE